MRLLSASKQSRSVLDLNIGEVSLIGGSFLSDTRNLLLVERNISSINGWSFSVFEIALNLAYKEPNSSIFDNFRLFMNDWE